MPDITEFQRVCRAALETLLGDHNISASFEVIHGEQEDYLMSSVNVQERELKIFIYEDEAGFFIGKKWRPYEAVDFASEEHLTAALINDLKEILASE